MRHLSVSGRGAFVAAAVAVGLSLAAQSASAAVITALPGGEAQAFTRNPRPVTGPQAFGDDGTYLVTSLAGVPTSSYLGYTGSFTIPTSGASTNWGGGEPFAAVGLSTVIMSFSFADPVAAVLSEFAWSAAAGKVFTLRAYNSAGKLLERLSFDADSPDYSKGYYGFERATNDISRFEVEGYYFATRDLSTLTKDVTGAVPEPATWIMMIGGFGLAGATLRGRRRVVLGAA
ncbi:MAG: PEPxxWA-CTERM sorting domain-containing protein [Phenylobacterium sp.]|nr:PEPxxWA-CTERM sorting domain-containing protein [Phenylobacterium sp.]